MNRTDEPEAVVSDLWPASRRQNNGSLDGERHIVLHRGLADLDRILPLPDPTDEQWG